MTEAFSFLNPLAQIPGVRAGWIERLDGIQIDCDRDQAMTRLRQAHQRKVQNLAGADVRWWRAEQVHGNQLAVVPGVEEIMAADGLPVVAGVDGLITNEPGQLLGIYVADCGAIWLADRDNGTIGLLHSGKKGTEGNILGQAVQAMGERFGCRPENLVAVLSPCIRPPHYEINFAATIARQAKDAGIELFHDCALNTAEDLERFYSYRMEKGKTGRMLAMLMRE